jgi:hypothetical protein
MDIYAKICGVVVDFQKIDETIYDLKPEDLTTLKTKLEAILSIIFNFEQARTRSCTVKNNKRTGVNADLKTLLPLLFGESHELKGILGCKTDKELAEILSCSERKEIQGGAVEGAEEGEGLQVGAVKGAEERKGLQDEAVNNCREEGGHRRKGKSQGMEKSPRDPEQEKKKSLRKIMFHLSKLTTPPLLKVISYTDIPYLISMLEKKQLGFFIGHCERLFKDIDVTEDNVTKPVYIRAIRWRKFRAKWDSRSEDEQDSAGSCSKSIADLPICFLKLIMNTGRPSSAPQHAIGAVGDERGLAASHSESWMSLCIFQSL